ncbi:SDR family oxidoreductase [Micromonospora endolithica]|uniref:SDR family oxidoreductase n=1 Tax=Micromonospora endolithica TaxID=230091 RepID=A0A3A9ZDA4_9ACTN|nr:SDR family oxidoreductase [Micromonospora endolithica]RKN45346.1 SDR family oxidoreductase [Micromonospora endolithica]TWJ22955.1 3-oxoacyl-[acyl-carrier protein] reductase [Micromonospora endolithica]
MDVRTRILEGKGAVVTGGSRGIGRAVVRRLAHDGATVVFGWHHDAAAAAEVEKEVAADGGVAHGVRADLGDPAGVDTLFAGARTHLPGLDLLVNNAAARHTPALLVDLPEDEFDRLMAVNARAVFLALRHAARHMRDGGRVVNLSTINTVMPGPGIAAYAASKGAVEQLSGVASRELAARGITVNTVSPGATDTDLLRSTNSEQSLEMAARITPMGRLGQPADVANVIAFLCGPDARWVTGQNIHAAGGLG